jgi:hypothetical protein
MAARKTLLPSEKKLTEIGIEELMSRVANGEYYRLIAEDCGVSTGSLMAFLEKHPDLYARSKNARADFLAEQVLEIADIDPGHIDNGATDSGAVAHQRLRVDTRKWVASKMFPKRYGDSSTIDIGNKGGVPFAKVDLGKLTDAELQTYIALQSKIEQAPE